MTEHGSDDSDQEARSGSDAGYWHGTIPPPDGEDALVGLVLSNTYKVVRILGEGGMGRVYEAQHVRIRGKRFALKTLHPEFTRRKDVLARFQREVEAAASIDSPHVVGVYDVDQTEDGRPFLVSELLEGKELGDYLDQAGKISVGFSVHVVRQICRALTAAHDKGVVHRDMKPENVFLAGDAHDPVVKVLDFGISRLEGQEGNTLTKTGMVMGTPSYMAPEQAKGLRVDHRADVYSVGAILYQMVTGRIPFDRADATATLAAVLTEEPERPRSIAPEVPEHIEMIIQRAMARNPDDRYKTMAELDAALSPYDEAEILDEPSVSMRIRIPRKSLVDAAGQARAVSDARPQLLILGTLALAGTVLALLGAVSGGMRLARGGAAPIITGTEALVVGLVLVAAMSTPLVLLIRQIKLTTWSNTAKVLELTQGMRWPVVVGFATYGLFAILVRVLETFFLRSPLGVAWPLWDLLAALLAVLAGVLVYLGRGESGFIGRMGNTAALSAGTSLVVIVVLAAAVLRGSPEATAAGVDGAPKADASGQPAGSAAADDDDDEPIGIDEPANTTPMKSKEGYMIWSDEVMGSLKLGKTKEAVDALGRLLEVDPEAPKDKNVRLGVLDLTVKACLQNGETCDKMLDLLTSKMGTAGPDVLFELIATKGGTNAQRHAERLLRDEAVRKRGNLAMNVAWELRTAPNCDAKKALFGRAKKDGDYRALRELQILKSRRQCRAVSCCLGTDQDLADTIRAIMDRQ